MNKQTYSTNPGSYYVSVRNSHPDFPFLYGFWVETGPDEHFEKLSREDLLLLQAILAIDEYVNTTQHKKWEQDPTAEICEMLGNPPTDSVLRSALRLLFQMTPDVRYGLLQPIQEHLLRSSLHNRRK